MALRRGGRGGGGRALEIEKFGLRNERTIPYLKTKWYSLN